MMEAVLLAFNRGLVDPRALARVDLKRLALSASHSVNFLPLSLGPMMLRPGLGYVETAAGANLAKYIPFVFAIDDTAILEMTDSKLRILVDDVPISRVAVSSAVANGGFNTDLTSWTDSDESGATSVWATGGYMSLTGTGVNAAIRDQQVTVSSGDRNKEHALRIVVTQGTVVLRVGSSAGSDDYITETTLFPGTHSLAFTPTGDFHIRLFNRNKYAGLVDSVTVEGPGVLEITTTWVESDLPNLRWRQSGDVVFIACKGQQQRRVERRSARSWSCVKYMASDGPFRAPNVGSIRLDPSAISGNITVTASKALFRSTHVGALFAITSAGQQVTADAGGADQWTDPIRVTGIDAGRQFAVTIAGTFTGTVRLQQSVEEPGAWTDVSSWTTPTSTTHDDTLDNQIIYYRLGIKTGEYGSGTASLRLTYSAGSITGVVRITGYTSSTSVSAEVIKDLGGTSDTDDWAEGAWSDRRGWPTSVEFHEGRLWWAGKDRIDGSVSDSYHSFDPDYLGDAGPITRAIGQGPVDTINWISSSHRMVVGGQAQEFSGQSSSIDEPLTPSNFKLSKISSQGSAAVPAVNIDGAVVFVQRGGYRLYEAVPGDSFSGYVAQNLSAIYPNIGKPGIVRMDVQRQPDTRLHCVRSDGTVAVLVYDKAENIRCWTNYETDGYVVDVVVMPGDGEDVVYYEVKRNIGGVDYHYLEKLAKDEEAIGGTVNKQADSFVHYSGVAATAITGLDHLEGETVVAWGDGKDLGTYVVASGSITISEACSEVIVGLSYRARFRSTKLAGNMSGPDSMSLMKRGRINDIGLILANTHAQGLRYGPDFDTMDDLPLVERGEDVADDYIWEHYDQDAITFPGEWSPDSRVCLEANAPRPATVLAVVVGVDRG